MKEKKHCRLCGGDLKDVFRLQLLCKYDVRYYRCCICHSLQTEEPYWLEEAYRNNISNLDTGIAQRNLHNFAACYVVTKVFDLKNVIDFGGGDGLLCRLLRDHNINCYVQDKYATPTYAQGFTKPDFIIPDLVTAFEVFEHYVCPESEMETIFSGNPDFLLVTTEIYADQADDWYYLAPESGQHVFFYSENALKNIAKKFGYKIIISGGYILFAKYKLLTFAKSTLIKFLLKNPIRRLIRGLVVLLPVPGVWKDHTKVKD